VLYNSISLTQVAHNERDINDTLKYGGISEISNKSHRSLVEKGVVLEEWIDENKYIKHLFMKKMFSNIINVVVTRRDISLLTDSIINAPLLKFNLLTDDDEIYFALKKLEIANIQSLIKITNSKNFTPCSLMDFSSKKTFAIKNTRKVKEINFENEIPYRNLSITYGYFDYLVHDYDLLTIEEELYETLMDFKLRYFVKPNQLFDVYWQKYFEV